MGRRWLIAALGVALLTASREGQAVQLRAPRNVNGTPGSPQSAALASRAAVARMNGRPMDALVLAEQGIGVDPDDPWPYYNKAMALTELGRVDDAAAAFRDAERRFFPGDLWGKSVALYGRGHAYAQAGRCAEAREAFEEYAALVGGYDPKSVDLVRRYEAECRASRASEAPAAGASSAPSVGQP